MEAMRHFIPAAFEAGNGVLIALLGLCLRSRHISSSRSGIDVVVLFRKKRKASVEYFFHSESHVLH